MSNPFSLPLLIYDSECTLCVRFKMTIEKMSSFSHLHYTSIHNEELYLHYPLLKKEECLEVVHLIDENGKIFKGPEVMTYLIELLPGVSKLSWMVESKAGQKAIEFFHNTANKQRQKLINECSSCKK